MDDAHVAAVEPVVLLVEVLAFTLGQQGVELPVVEMIVMEGVEEVVGAVLFELRDILIVAPETVGEHGETESDGKQTGCDAEMDSQQARCVERGEPEPVAPGVPPEDPHGQDEGQKDDGQNGV